MTGVHPGSILTENTTERAQRLLWPFSALLVLVLRLVMYPPAYGAATLVFAGAAPEVRSEEEKYKGTYLVPVGKVGKVTKAGEDRGLAKELWETTEGLLREWGLA